MVAVVADSAANLPGGMASELGIEVVPMYLKFGEAIHREGVDLMPADFYQRLVRDEMAASTSLPPPADFLEAFERTGADEIVCVTIASTMSGAHKQAAVAASRFEGRVEVVDSMNASMGEGFGAAEAARLARSGATLTEVARRAREVTDRAVLLAAVDTFEFLQRSGRVNKLEAYAATMLDIKPVFRFARGDVAAVARPRTRARAHQRIVEEALRAIGDRPVHLAAIHAAAAEDALAVLERIAASADVVERVVVEVTPVIGANTGPGMVGVAFFTD